MINRLRPFFSFYGSKFNLAPRYPAPQFDSIVELFAGSAAYACCYPHFKVRLVDADPSIYALWSYLISVKESEILFLPDIQLGQDIDSLGVCEEAKILIGFWCGKGQTTPARRILDNRWTRNYKLDHLCHYWGYKVRERIAFQLQFIRHWSISLASWENEVDERQCTWFIDPPYQNDAGSHYRCNHIDYNNLRSSIYALSGQVIVCEQQGAMWLPFLPFASIKANNSVSGKVRYSQEVYWTATFPPREDT